MYILEPYLIFNVNNWKSRTIDTNAPFGIRGGVVVSARFPLGKPFRNRKNKLTILFCYEY
jgi:hypothetical protein